MARLEKAFKIFTRQGVKFFLIELVVVFLGVYLAFLFQSYVEQKKVHAEKEKIMIGLKKDMEYFRIFFPEYAGEDQIQEWQKIVTEREYIDFHNWRFIQPQYDYTAIEYALSRNAEVIDYELNSTLAQIYQELQKLEYVENLLTELSMSYKSIPDNAPVNSQILLETENNRLNFLRFVSRYEDRSSIMKRIADISSEYLPHINASFDSKQLKEIELELIQNYATPSNQQEVEAISQALQVYFPNLAKEEIQQLFKID